VEEKIINILLVEDDEIDVSIVKRAFNKNKITNPLYVAGNGEEALKMLKGIGCEKITPIPSIILLDLNMPKMGGIQFLTEIRKDPGLKSISVFVMTTSNEESDKVAAYELNVAGYVLKPLSFENFNEAISVLKHYWKLCEKP
jgi:CheY-like chemotaxis protein